MKQNDLDNDIKDLSTNEYSTDEDVMTPLRRGTRIRHPPDICSPSHIILLFILPDYRLVFLLL